MDRQLPARPAHGDQRVHVHRPAARGGARPLGVTNVTLEIARREYERLRSRFPAFCGCETCAGDVLVYAMNRLQPHYVSTRQGEVLTEISLSSDQEKAKLDVVLVDGLRRVALAPRCGAKSVTLA